MPAAVPESMRRRVTAVLVALVVRVVSAAWRLLDSVAGWAVRVVLAEQEGAAAGPGSMRWARRPAVGREPRAMVVPVAPAAMVVMVRTRA